MLLSIPHSTRFLLVVLVLGIVLAAPHIALAATFNPPCTSGVGDAAALQAAIITANSNGEADTINLVPGCTYTTTAELQIGADGGNSLAIFVPGSATIAAGGAFRVLSVSTGADVDITGVTISGGSAPNGAGILNNGALALNVVTISGNSASSFGGGLSNEGGTAELYQTFIIGNSAPNGGGVFNSNSGYMHLTFSQVMENTASGNGGGVWNQGATFSMLVSEVISNTSTGGSGGGIWNDNQGGDIDMYASLIKFNNAANGVGGILFESGDLTVDDVVFGNNNQGGTNGALVFAGSSSSFIIGSCITNNADTAVTAINPIPITNTWWGAPDGPSGAGPGSGDSISANVSYTPFLTTASSGCDTLLPPTTTTLTSDVNPALIGQTVTFTATVTSSSGTPTGTVTFSIDGTPQAPVALASGVAAFTTSALSVGSHTITATYSGDSSFAASTSPDLTQVVTAANTATVQITPTSFLTSEGSTVAYQIQLSHTPSVAPVTISLLFDGTALSVNGSTTPIALSFSDTTPQTITVDVLPDPLNNTTRSLPIDHTISASSAPEYPTSSVLPTVYVQIQDDLAPILPTHTLPPPPASPTCAADNFDENSVIRTGIPDAMRYAINCRILYQYGRPTQWLGGNLYHAGSIGVEGLETLGIQQAVDIFSPSGMNHFEGGAVFCVKGSGYLIWLAASQSPRHAEIIGSYTVPEFPGFTCATLFEPGTLVLVSQNPIR